jgi:SOS-response transcriptional repressor LexA
VKTFRRDGNTIVLVPSNDALEPLRYDPKDVTIFGKVVTVMRRL